MTLGSYNITCFDLILFPFHLVDNYVKGEVKQLDPEPVFQDIIVEGAIEMKVKAGSKIRNLMSFALKKFEVLILHISTGQTKDL